MSRTLQDDLPPEQEHQISEVGNALRVARETLGVSVLATANHLRIRAPYLQALEDGQHQKLPGGTYAIGFLRTYAEYLGLDPEEMVRRFRIEASGALGRRSTLLFPAPVSEGRTPGGAILLLGLILAGLAYGGWYVLSSRELGLAELVPTLPDRFMALFQTESSTPSPPNPSPGTTPPASAPSQTVTPDPREDAPPPLRSLTPPPVAAPSAPAPTVATPAPPPPVAVAPSAPEPPQAVLSESDRGAESRIRLKASVDDCWLEIHEMDGRKLVARLLRKGENYDVPNRPGLTMQVGNAGALTVTVDGKKAASLGALGQTKRDIKLDADRMALGG